MEGAQRVPSVGERVEHQAAQDRARGCRRYSNDVTMPKLPPPPRRPQKRSALSVGAGRHSDLGGDTTSAATGCRRQAVLAASQPKPPPASGRRCRVGDDAAGGARPNACVSRSKSPQGRPACGPRRWATGSTRIPSSSEVDHQPAVADRVAGDVVAAAATTRADRARGAKRATPEDVRHPGAARDQRRPLCRPYRSRPCGRGSRRRGSTSRAAPRSRPPGFSSRSSSRSSFSEPVHRHRASLGHRTPFISLSHRVETAPRRCAVACLEAANSGWPGWGPAGHAGSRCASSRCLPKPRPAAISSMLRRVSSSMQQAASHGASANCAWRRPTYCVRRGRSCAGPWRRAGPAREH